MPPVRGVPRLSLTAKYSPANGHHVMLETEVLVTVRWEQVRGVLSGAGVL